MVKGKALAKTCICGQTLLKAGLTQQVSLFASLFFLHYKVDIQPFAPYLQIMKLKEAARQQH